MKILSVLIAVLIFLPFAFAVPDSVVTGPYNVSFDLGLPSDTYDTIVNDPVIDETMSGGKRTEYSMMIASANEENEFMTISIVTLETPMPDVLTGADLEDVLRQKNADDPRNSNFESASRTIDGMSGAVASMDMSLDSGQVLTGYSAIYAAAFDPTHSMVNIFSSYPWNEGTLQLLKTIHVERVK